MLSLIITGGTGFIGSNLIKKFVALDYDIHVICRKSSKLNNIYNFLDNITIYRYNNNLNELIDYFKNIKPYCVFHLASLFISEHTTTDINSLIDSNIKFGTHILEAMLQSNTKLIINTSTSWQNYNNEIYNPVCLYAATKEAFEKLLDFYVKAKNFKAITLKLFDTYGENDTRKKLINQFNIISKEGTILNMSKGEQKINLVHIDDVVEAYIKALDYLKNIDKPTHEEFAVASKNSISLQNLVQIYENTTGNKLNINWGYREYREREVMIPWNNYKLLPNWECKISLEEGLKRFDKQLRK